MPDVADGPLHLADAAVADHGDGLEKVQVHLAALLGADLEDALRLLEDLDDLLPLVDGEGQRLFAIDILAGLHRVDGDFRVPVVGRDDRDHVDVLAVEHPAVIAADVDFPLSLRSLIFFDELVRLAGVHRVDVADGHAVEVLQRPRPVVSVPLAPRADAAHDRALARAGEGGGPVGAGREPEGDASRRGGAAEVFKKSRRVCGLRLGWSLFTGRAPLGWDQRRVARQKLDQARVNFSLIEGLPGCKSTKPTDGVRGPGRVK